VIVVTHDSSSEIGRSLPAIAGELRDGDELIVCDNASSDGTPDLVRELVPGAAVLEWGANLGFGAACNAGAAAARGELLLFLNPDAAVEPGFRDAIELPLLEGRGWDAWQGLVTSEAGTIVNTWGGIVHFTGISWAGGAGRPISEAPGEPREVSYASGACLAVRREAWEALAGFSEEYFLYHEDTDLGLRLWLTGSRVGIEPRARCDHDYDFDKGAHKWYFLERNRWATVIRTYPRRLLLALLPALLATELALLAVAAAGGWLPEKLRAGRDLARALPRLLRERSAIRDSEIGPTPGARIGPGRFADLLTPGLDSEYLGAAARSGLLSALLAGYWRLARLITG
jgi:N-acetylglucosaminyl-diphospho-decaprenol L-rhamnosyltransferase